ncbi:peptidyl-prolyl cis-trans isomerase [Algimonas arctica]|uniref:peptidylprolyl isomerase n=1 Tax=Algimonas arctica TaxID=1479486 RepID=A0A8J3CU23_9PROT|nr:peptidylprolyl isomerase [Algimonas arctica]GHB01556.1 peptidyl-prolyl cis-trans isomerase [Algimonas arctica]
MKISFSLKPQLRLKAAVRLTALSTLAIAGPACSAESTESYADGEIKSAVTFPETAWRTVEADNLMLIDTAYGVIGVELFPEIAPNHVAQVKALVRDGFYDGVVFHRVIVGFMNQTGDGQNGNGTGDSELPDIAAEFTFRRGEDMGVTLVSSRGSERQQIATGFYKGLPVASQPISQAILTKDGKVAAFGLHCKGVTSMARTSEPNSANSQFFLMRGKAEHLDAQYSVWGATVMGYDYLTSFKVGVVGEDGFVPDQMNNVKIAADLPEADRPTVQVLDTTSDAFTNWISTQSYDDVCDVQIPSRTQ